jgi:Predicted ATP-grasp enzyme
VPSPLEDTAGFVNAVASLRSSRQIDVIIPTTDDSLLALLPARDRLSPALMPVGSDQAYRSASDKALLQSIAPRFGIAVPRQASVNSPGDLESLELVFPVVVKSSRSASDDGSHIRRHMGARHAATANELRAIVAETPEDSYPLLVQERIVGPGVGIFLLLWGGEEIAVFSHRRLREKPPSGGVSVYSESIEPDADLACRSRALLSHLGFEGVAMVEYKLHSKTGVPYLMEVNGRFWGSLQLAIDAGVDFPQLLMSAAIDGILPPKPTPIPGVRMRWWWGEVDHLLARLRQSPAELDLPADAGSRWRALRDFLQIRRGERNQVFRVDDPFPALRETLNWVRRR